MLKQTTLMHTAANYINNKPAQNKNENQTAPAHTATQPITPAPAPAPLDRGAYELTFGGKGGKGISARALKRHIENYETMKREVDKTFVKRHETLSLAFILEQIRGSLRLGATITALAAFKYLTVEERKLPHVLQLRKEIEKAEQALRNTKTT